VELCNGRLATYGTREVLEGNFFGQKTIPKVSGRLDHDHCEFCGKKFSESPEDLHFGYTTLDDYYWICEPCFNDFEQMFEWKVIPFLG
jgi:hypothetical protein